MASLCLAIPSSSCLSSAPTIAITSCNLSSSPCVSFLPPFLVRRRRTSTDAGGRRRRLSLSIQSGIRAVESYDASFQLESEADQVLRKALSSKVFCSQVAEQSGKGTHVEYEFTGELFQPVPWSPTTKFGMPAELERFLHDKENFTIINVPPNYMFKAKIFKPSRLCAIYKRVQG